MTAQSIQQNPKYQNAIYAIQHGNFESAKQHLIALIESTGPEISVLQALAFTYSRLKETSKCIEVLDNALLLEPNNLTVLVMKGDLYWDQGDKRLANRCYTMALGIAKMVSDLPSDLVDVTNRIAKRSEKITADLEKHIHSQLKLEDFSEDEVKRFRQSLELMNGSKQIYPQKPRAYYFPELPVKQFYERKEFNWASRVEEATDEICAELNALIKNNAPFEPYIKSTEQGPTAKVNPLLDKSDWSAFFLIKDGEIVENNAAKCPVTMDVIKNIPLPEVKGRGPMVLFSMLKSHTKIAPHHGFLNTRLICHLPLVVPNNCGLRVGNEIRNWKRGELVVFDDSIEHEAWNNSDQDRVVLIFDIWRPELSQQEREWVSTLLETIDTYGN